MSASKSFSTSILLTVMGLLWTIAFPLPIAGFVVSIAAFSMGIITYQKDKKKRNFIIIILNIFSAVVCGFRSFFFLFH